MTHTEPGASIRERHFLALAGSDTRPRTRRDAEWLWRQLQKRRRRGEVSDAQVERARAGFEQLRQCSEQDTPTLVRSRVFDSRCGSMVPIALNSTGHVYSPVRHFDVDQARVRAAIERGEQWIERGAAELAALVRAVRSRLRPILGFSVSGLGPWRDLYIQYETHSVLDAAIDLRLGRPVAPKVRPSKKVAAAVLAKRQTREFDVIVRRAPGQPDLRDQVGILFIDRIDGRDTEVTFEPFHAPIANAVVPVRRLTKTSLRIEVVDDDDGARWSFDLDDPAPTL